MKIKKRLWVLTIFGFLLIIIVRFQFVENTFNNGVSLLLRNGFFIPKESNIYSFKENQSDDGSGGYWLYAEDDTYYYSTMTKNAPYTKVLKENVKYNKEFDKYNIETWEKLE